MCIKISVDKSVKIGFRQRDKHKTYLPLRKVTTNREGYLWPRDLEVLFKLKGLSYFYTVVQGFKLKLCNYLVTFRLIVIRERLRPQFLRYTLNLVSRTLRVYIFLLIGVHGSIIVMNRWYRYKMTIKDVKFWHLSVPTHVQLKFEEVTFVDFKRSL